MHDGRDLERLEHAGVETFGRDDAPELPGGSGKRGIVAAGCRDDAVDQTASGFDIAHDKVGFESGRQHPIAIDGNVIQMCYSWFDECENVIRDPVGRLNLAVEQGQGGGVDGRVIGLRVGVCDSGAVGVFVEFAALTEQCSPRRTLLGEGLVLLQPAEQAANVVGQLVIQSWIEAELVVLLECKRSRTSIREAQYRPVRQTDIPREQLESLGGHIVGAEELALVEEGLRLVQPLCGGGRRARRVGH